MKKVGANIAASIINNVKYTTGYGYKYKYMRKKYKDYGYGGHISFKNKTPKKGVKTFAGYTFSVLWVGLILAFAISPGVNVSRLSDATAEFTVNTA